MARYIGEETDTEELAGLINKSDSRPQRGEPYGGGRHVEIAEEYSEGAPGWLQLVRATKGVLECDAEKLYRLRFADALSGVEKTRASDLIGRLAIVEERGL